MKIAASVFTIEGMRRAEELKADMIEFRLDLAQEDTCEIKMAMEKATVPTILTLRSVHEGGVFRGGGEAWFDRIEPFLGTTTYVDTEMRFKAFSDRIRASGASIIASIHMDRVLHMDELKSLESALRSYGDLPKIVVAVSTHEDLLELLAFTLRAEKPVCTGTCGQAFAYSRFLLPLFGSEIVYCHAGTPTAEGQYHLKEFRSLYSAIFKSQ
ncbi:MAG: type I 3-dehydroquinate dehydratase [Methanomicrobiales archaeon]|nr:type I 3-dehydroquinate dehydratase [Methanomicrobiales archaeon]